MTAPQPFRWSGEAMLPIRPKAADREYVIGETYVLCEHLDRSRASHNHYFAELHTLWLNLPEGADGRFPNEEALRKFCLIKAGYCDSRSIVCGSKAEAQRVAAFVKPMDPFAVVMIEQAVVTVFTAKSQSLKAMGRQAFNESKQKVLEIAAQMVGVSREDLARQEAA